MKASGLSRLGLRHELWSLRVRTPVYSKAHRGSTVRPCRFIKGHNGVDCTGETNTSPCFRLLLQLLFCLLLLLVFFLFPILVLILLAFVSHCVPPFPVFPHLLAARPRFESITCLKGCNQKGFSPDNFD
jgi:hypothetical protein